MTEDKIGASADESGSPALEDSFPADESGSPADEGGSPAAEEGSPFSDNWSPGSGDTSPQEVVIEGDDGMLFFSPDSSDLPPPPILRTSTTLCQIYLPRLDVTFHGDYSISMSIPTSFIPDRLAMINGLDRNPVLLHLTLTLLTASSFTGGAITDLMNPVFGSLFPGRMLVHRAAAAFMASDYRPRPAYRSQLYVMEPQGFPEEAQLGQLRSEGFSEAEATRALLLTRGNLSAARDFLATGTTAAHPDLPEIGFRECPLFFLVLELAEAFFDLGDHCCICGKPLGISVLRPSLCDDRICFFGATELGIGSDVVSELRRDPAVADFLVSLASTAHGTKWFRPALPPELEPHAVRFFAELPAIERIAACGTDAEIVRQIGAPFFEILRFILMSNRVHLVHLPPSLKLRECASETEQFLCVNGAPEREFEFQARLKESGRQWLWHGSTASRWHSILHTGLQDLGKTADRTHMGADTYGPGIYQSEQSAVSTGYASGVNPALGAKNDSHYKNSKFGGGLLVMALCENVTGPLLRHVASGEWTQQDLPGLMVRCLLIVRNWFQWNLLENPNPRVPSFVECRRWIAEHATH
jgi:hypothetical protein